MILRPDHPYNHVIIAISRGDKRRAATTRAPVHIPTVGDGRRIGCRDAKSRKDIVTVVVGPESDKGVLLGSIGCGRLEDSAAGNLRLIYGCTDYAEVVSIHQICIAILTHRNNKMGRCCAGHVHQQWAGTTKVRVALIE